MDKEHLITMEMAGEGLSSSQNLVWKLNKNKLFKKGKESERRSVEAARGCGCEVLVTSAVGIVWRFLPFHRPFFLKVTTR